MQKTVRLSCIIIALGCSNAPSRPLTDSTMLLIPSPTSSVLQLSSAHGSAAPARLPYQFRNSSSDTVFVTRCGDRPAWILEERQVLRWSTAFEFECPANAVPPIELGPGAEFVDTALVGAPSRLPTGVVRIAVRAYTTRGAAAAAGSDDLVATDARTSRPFVIRGP